MVDKRSDVTLIDILTETKCSRDLLPDQQNIFLIEFNSGIIVSRGIKMPKT